jgi:hypothetical protein
MSSDTIEPPLGSPHPETPRSSDSDEPDVLSDHGLPPRPPGALSSSSSDDLSAALSEAAAKPDPFLGAFSSEEKADESPAPVPEPPGFPPPSESFDAIAPLNAFTEPTPVEPVIGPPTSADASPTVPASPAPVSSGSFDAIDSAATAAAPTQPSSFDAFPALGAAALQPEGSGFDPVLMFPPVASDPSPAQHPASSDDFPQLDLSAPPSADPGPKSPKDDDEDDDDDYEDNDARGGLPNWVVPLLASWASAMTVGLLWVLLSGRKLAVSEDFDTAPVADASPDPGIRADQSRKIVIGPPVATDHMTTIGQTVQMGSLEVTPLSVTSGRIRLKRAMGDQRKDGGSDALKLRLRFKNVSKDIIFAPLDEAFVRERQRGAADSLIETADDGQIEMYSLAVQSEWTIDGQVFQEIGPGESFESVVVSAADTSGHRTPQMTWRVRLRTGINQTDSLGVRFADGDVTPGK